LFDNDGDFKTDDFVISQVLDVLLKQGMANAVEDVRAMRFASMLSCDCSSSVDTCLLNAELFFVQCNKSRKYHFYTFSFEGASQN